MVSELEKLQKKVDDLERIVKKQTLLISKTGENVIELQLSKQKSGVAALAAPGSGNLIDPGDVATNNDFVELVRELQGELDRIEERSIRRLANTTKTEPSDIIAPLPNADGDVPALKDGFFPETVKDFQEISDIQLFRLAKFYERLALNAKEMEKYEEYLEGKIGTMQITDTSEEDLKKEIAQYSKSQIDDLFNDVARYLGLRIRRGTDSW